MALNTVKNWVGDIGGIDALFDKAGLDAKLNDEEKRKFR